MKVFSGILLILFCGAVAETSQAYGQAHMISGHLHEEQSREPVPFATIAARKLKDSSFMAGTASDFEGNFRLEIPEGNYQIQITALGYGKVNRNLDLKEDMDLGNIPMQQRMAVIDEIVVLGERTKARKEFGKTTYFVNENLHKISATGSEMLSYLPGIQVDLTKNISLNGNRNILILVDGRERDKNFISQIDPDKIDRVEVSDSPGSGYDATVSGVINIILSEEAKSGISGHVYAEIPTSLKAIYSFPSYNIAYRFKKLDLFTSYNGEYSFFDIVESEIRNFESKTGSVNNITKQYVRQKDRSDRFHYGAAYNIGKHDYINFYGFYNPYSREFDGKVDFLSETEKGEETLWYLKDDTDRNNSAFYSLYYRHGFENSGSEISLDINYNRFSAENSTRFYNEELPADNSLNRINIVRPFQNSVNARLDFSSKFSQTLKFNSGIKARLQRLTDRNSEVFTYNEDVYAAYGILTLSLNSYTFRAGLRAEQVMTELKGSGEYHELNFLPQASVTWKLSDKQGLELSYNATIYRPNIYELNPYTSINDPFSLSSGNPDLGSETRNEIKLGYSKFSAEYFFSAALCSKVRSHAIDRYAFINFDGLLEKRIANLGSISENGIQFTGTLKVNRAVSVNSFFKLYGISTSGNEITTLYEIPGRNKAAFESSLSAIAKLKHEIAISFLFQYNSPGIGFQETTFSNPLWFITAEKTIKKNLKLGITSALPLTRLFTYRGFKINQGNLYSYSDGKLELPHFPVWFKIRYQFSTGAKTGKVKTATEDFINIPRKGF